MSAKLFAPTPDQLRASNPKLSVWVSANAGSGKTHVLVERVMRLLLSGAEPKSILCITYTKAAAAEMAERLFKRLSEWTNLDDDALALSLLRLGERGNDPTLRKRARRLFTQALETPGGLKIQTIHAFCEKLLHLFPVEAGLAPGFSVMDERRVAELQAHATNVVLDKAERETESEEAKAFLAISDRVNAEQFQFLISDYVYALRKLKPEILRLGQQAFELALRTSLGLGHVTFERVIVEIAAIDRTSYLQHAQILEQFGKHGSTNPAKQLFDIAQSSNPTTLLDKFYFSKGSPRVSLLSVLAAKSSPVTKVFLTSEQSRLDQLFQNRGTLEITKQSSNAFVLAKSILNHIAVEKQRLGLYDFQDLITRAAALLSNRNATQWVLKKLDQNLSHILVDEAQDTSPEQWHIVKALSEEFFAGLGSNEPGSRSLFIVGDQKQSIFSFQGADAQGFNKTQEALSEQAAGQLQSVELTISYRSTVNVLKAVDRVFPPEKLLQLGITSSTERGHEPSRRDEDGVVELWPFLDPDDQDAKPEAWTKPIDRPPETSPQRKLARHIASKIQIWLSGRVLPNKNKEPIKAGDILILFQTRSELYRMVLAELRQRDINVAGADRLQLLESLIVQDLLMLLNWLLLPQDDHALAVLLKSPLVPQPLNEEELFNLSYDRGAARLVDLLVGPNATYLAMLQLRAKSEGPFSILSSILTWSRKAIALRLGSEALEASNAILDLALDYEAEHGLSLFGFLRWFSATDTTLKRDMDKAKGEVRLMTVHGAKGLEAKVVIIADATYVKKASNNRPNVMAMPILGLPVWKVSGIDMVTPNLQAWFDFNTTLLGQERNRLLYVAMTRAVDELYICGTKGKSKVGETSWWPTITAALGEPDSDKPIRIGEPDTFATIETKALKVEETTPWLFTNPELETRGKVIPTQAATLNTAAAKRGTALHRLLQDVADVAEDRRFSIARQKAIALDLNEADASQMVDLVSRADLKIYFGQGSQSEVDIIGVLPNGVEISGRIDRIAILPNGIWLLDYKTNQAGAELLSPTHPYIQQLAHYCALLAEAYPNRPIHAALLWTQTGELQSIPEPLITAALQEIERSVT